VVKWNRRFAMTQPRGANNWVRFSGRKPWLECQAPTDQLTEYLARRVASAQPILAVAGHRQLRWHSPVRRAVHWVFEAFERQHRFCQCSVLSSLADGADHVLTRRAMRRLDAKLRAVMPADAIAYRKTLTTPAARRRFDRLWRHAAEVQICSGGAEPNYRLAADRLAEDATLIVVLWDGLPRRGSAGTAVLVDFARTRQRPVIWIGAESPMGGCVGAGEIRVSLYS
jgi:hypothetical protein